MQQHISSHSFQAHRSSQPVLFNTACLKQRVLTINPSSANFQDQLMKNHKLRIRTEDSHPPINLHNQIQKLNQICQLYHAENEKLKQKDREREIHNGQEVWKRRVSDLESIIRRKQEIVEEKNRQIQELESMQHWPFGNAQGQLKKMNMSVELTKSDSNGTCQILRSYNERFLKMLNVSSREIERLNNLLKNKMTEIEVSRQVIKDQENLIGTLRLSLGKFNQPNTKEVVMTDEVMRMGTQNKWLKEKLNQQKLKNEELSSLIQKLRSEQKMNQQVEAQINKMKEESNSKILKLQQENRSLNELLQRNQTENRSLYSRLAQQNWQWSNQSKKQAELEAALSRAQKSLIQKQEELQSLSAENNKVMTYFAQIEEKEQKDNQLPAMIQQIMGLETRLADVTGLCQGLLAKVEGSCAESQLVKRQIEVMIGNQKGKIQAINRINATKTG